MKRYTECVWLSLSALTACGPTSDADTAINFSVPWRADLAQCTDSSNLITFHMGATLVIGGGFPDCPLTVDSSTLAVSGSCPDIPVGSPRDLMVIYSLVDPYNEANVIPVAYVIGYVDLRPAALTNGQTSVVVDLTADGVHSVEIADYASYLALPNAPDQLLFAAEQWATAPFPQGPIMSRPGIINHPLDCTGNGTSSLVMACSSPPTIFDKTISSCHQ